MSDNEEGRPSLASLDAMIRDSYGPVIRASLERLYGEPLFGPKDGLTDEARAKLVEFIRTGPLDDVVKLLPDPIEP